MQFKQLIMALVLLLIFPVQAAVPTQEAEPAIQNQAPPDETPVFGQWVFEGEFANESFSGFNPNYEIGIGDRISLQIWGGYEFQQVLEVDAQGNIFIPKVGPVHVMNVRNSELIDRLKGAISGVYTSNVGIYATLETSQPVKVYVTGFVNQPGLYSGLSSDSVLYFLDKAGGINPRSGSYIDISIMRGGQVYRTVNLYDFLLKAELPAFQLVDGDKLMVHSRQKYAQVSGMVQNRNTFEFKQDAIPLPELLDMAKPMPEATHVRILRNKGLQQSAEYYPLNESQHVYVDSGADVELVSDTKVASIAVRVEGEHDGQQEFILPYGTRLGQLLPLIQMNPRSDTESIQLFRDSVKKRQKVMLDNNLKALESALLTARSNTNDEAELRTREAELVMQWVERAKDIEPRGQVVLAGAESTDSILLEPGDVIRVPKRTALVMVHGEVLAPTATALSSDKSVLDYINQAGGFNQREKDSRVLVLHRDGTFSQVDNDDLSKRTLMAGDEILVLPQVAVKSMQIAKDLTQIIYQIAVAAGVVLNITY